MKKHNQKTEVYDDDFYEHGFGTPQMSSESARIYTDHLTNFFLPKSVIDLGCGRGVWLKAFKDRGATKLIGVDGDWNSQDKMLDEEIIFQSADLNNLQSEPERYDLAMSLEVAEHLVQASSEDFVGYLTKSSDTVLFGAAYENQGGINHINEQKHSYWAGIFKLNGFLPFDFFREKFWGNQKVGFWYRQNIFLYLKKDTEVFNLFNNKGFSPLQDFSFMNCIHPELYDSKCSQAISFSVHAKEIIPSLFRAIKKRIVRK